MALPKRRHSSTRRNKRRGRKYLKEVKLQKCKVTGVIHRPHVAYFYNNEMYYRGMSVYSKKNRIKKVFDNNKDFR